MCESYQPKPKVDTTRVDTTHVEEEIILDENGAPVIKEIPTGHGEGEGNTNTGAGTTDESKKEKKKAKPTEQPVTFDNL